MPKAPASWGIVGIGAFSETEIVPSIADVCDIASYCTRDTDKATRLALLLPNASWYQSIQEMVDDNRVTHVYVGSPTETHYVLARKFVDAGKTVLSEKPFAVSDVAVDVDAWVRDDPSIRSRIAVGWMYRYHPRWARILSILRSGQIGQIEHVEFFMSYEDSGLNANRWVWSLGGGSLALIGCYGVHVAQTIFGGIPISFDVRSKFRADGSADVWTRVHLAFSNGTASITCRVDKDCGQSLRVIGSDGWIEVAQPINVSADRSTTIRGQSFGRRISEWTDPADQFALEFLHAEESVGIIDNFQLDVIDNPKLMSQLRSACATESARGVNHGI